MKRALLLVAILLVLAGHARAEEPSLVATICPAAQQAAPGSPAILAGDVYNPTNATLLVRASATLDNESAGWNVTPPPRFNLGPRSYHNLTFQVDANASARNATATIGMSYGDAGLDAPVVALSPGAPMDPTAGECVRASFAMGDAAVVRKAATNATMEGGPGGSWGFGVALGGVGLGALALVAVARREHLWLALAAPILPLFTRLAPPHLLDQDVRRQVHDAIVARPGIHFSQILASCKLSIGVADHHLRVLQRGGLILSRKEGRNRAYYVTHARLPPLLPPSLGATSQLVLARVRATLDATYADIMREVGLSKAAVSYHVHALETRGLVDLVRRDDGTFVVRPR